VISIKIRTVKLFPDRPWRTIGMFPVRYEHCGLKATEFSSQQAAKFCMHGAFAMW
jgi:hypothetical protein